MISAETSGDRVRKNALEGCEVRKDDKRWSWSFCQMPLRKCKQIVVIKDEPNSLGEVFLIDWALKLGVSEIDLSQKGRAESSWSKRVEHGIKLFLFIQYELLISTLFLLHLPLSFSIPSWLSGFSFFWSKIKAFVNIFWYFVGLYFW